MTGGCLMSSIKILVVEDEVKLARLIELELKYEGYTVHTVSDGREGLEQALHGDFDLILLDIMLPSLNGIEICRRVRNSSSIPIIMLTAKDQVLDKVMGLDVGADDYMTKPFAMEELLARIRAALRRKTTPLSTNNVLKVNQLELDLDKHQVLYDTQSIELTKKEFDLLEYLMRNKNMALSREQILEKVWGYDYFGDTNVVDVYIRYLRSKIDDPFNTKCIHTVRGVGYMMKDA